MENSELADLARGAASGDPRALASLLDELAPLVVRTARLIVGAGSTTAEDAAQEALADLARRITTLREPEAVVAWAARIAVRRALRMARWERLRLRREVALGEIAASREPSGERSRALSTAFDRLPPRQRAIAVLRLYLGLSEADTASALDISTGAVKSQLHEARRKLANSLREAGFADCACAGAGERKVMRKADGNLIELGELADLLRAREGPARPQRYRRRRRSLLLAATAVSLAAAALVAVAVVRNGGEKAQPATTASEGTSSEGGSAASCVAAVEWKGTTYYGTGGLRKAISVAGSLGEGTVPSCGDTVPGSPSPARSVALARVAGLPPEMAIAVAGETSTVYVAPGFFPQIPGTALHDLIYGPNRDVPNERVGAEGCPASTTATIDGSVVSSGFGNLRVDAGDPDAEFPGDNPIFTDAETTITREDASTPYAEPGDSVQASVLVCRNPDDPHYLKLVATRVEITPG